MEKSQKWNTLPYVTATIFSEIISLQCSWIRRFHDNFHDWKVIPLFLIKNKFEESFKFDSNVDITKCSLKNFPRFYKKFLLAGVNILPFLLA